MFALEVMQESIQALFGLTKRNDNLAHKVLTKLFSLGQRQKNKNKKNAEAVYLVLAKLKFP